MPPILVKMAIACLLFNSSAAFAQCATVDAKGVATAMLLDMKVTVTIQSSTLYYLALQTKNSTCIGDPLNLKNPALILYGAAGGTEIKNNPGCSETPVNIVASLVGGKSQAGGGYAFVARIPAYVAPNTAMHRDYKLTVNAKGEVTQLCFANVTGGFRDGQSAYYAPYYPDAVD